MRFLKATLAVTMAAAATPALAVDDGPRAYFPLPAGTNVINVIGLFESSNSSLDPATAIKGANLDLNVGVLQYTRTLNIGGQSAALVAALPFGEVSGEATLEGPLGNLSQTFETSSSGIGDLNLGAIIGLVGSPALTREQFVQHKPGFSMGAMLWVTAPTGAYDPDKLINFGTNRWAIRLGAPLGWAIGGSYLSPNLTTIEFVPSVTFFTVNEDPFRADRRTQSALFRLESHITHNFSRAFWASIDLTANSGGATQTDGIDDDNNKTWAGAGISLGMNFSPALGAYVTYGSIYAGNDAAPEGQGFRINLRAMF
jgi:hypothetical protein